jgi:cell division protein FtsI/penicillin-binding protein 2
MSWRSYADTVEPTPPPDDEPRSQLRPQPPSSRPPEPSSSLAQRARLPFAVFVLIMLVVVIRLALWQVVGSGPTPQLVAAQPAPVARGRVIDHNGLLLAADDLQYDVYARPDKILADPKLRVSIPLSITEVLGTSAAAQLQSSATETQTILTREAKTAQCDVFRYELRQPDYLWCVPHNDRIYPQGGVAAHLLGFTNYQHQGIYGVEASYDAWLRSTAIWPAQDFPTTPQAIPDAWNLYLPSPVGRDLVLYLDAPLQYVVEQRLRDAVAQYEAEGGTIIIMDPRTGGILAMAVYPTFDPNRYSQAEKSTWVNADVSEVYEPGSVFKVVTMASAIDAGRLQPTKLFTDTGELLVSGRTIRNAEDQSYGRVTATEALAHSINVVSAQISLDLGPEVFYSYLRRFGFGRNTEIDLTGESQGIVGDGLNVFDLATNSFGQGISVTPVQMINAVAAIANKGVLLQPRIVKGMVKDGQVYYLPPRIISRPVKAETARELTQMMVYDVDSSSYAGFVPGFKVAGKTGTAEIPTPQGYTLPETITSFIAFLPADNPQLVIMVKLDKARYSRWAEQTAVPVLGQVAQDAVRILQINP